jgi:hypothetical protein
VAADLRSRAAARRRVSAPAHGAGPLVTPAAVDADDHAPSRPAPGAAALRSPGLGDNGGGGGGFGPVVSPVVDEDTGGRSAAATVPPGLELDGLDGRAGSPPAGAGEGGRQREDVRRLRGELHASLRAVDAALQAEVRERVVPGVDQAYI